MCAAVGVICAAVGVVCAAVGLVCTMVGVTDVLGGHARWGCGATGGGRGVRCRQVGMAVQWGAHGTLFKG